MRGDGAIKKRSKEAGFCTNDKVTKKDYVLLHSVVRASKEKNGRLSSVPKYVRAMDGATVALATAALILSFLPAIVSVVAACCSSCGDDVKEWMGATTLSSSSKHKGGKLLMT